MNSLHNYFTNCVYNRIERSCDNEFTFKYMYFCD